MRRVPGGRGGTSFAGADPYLYAERGYSASDYRQTTATGGEFGNLTGFGASFLFRIDALSTGSRIIAGHTNGGGNLGWFAWISANVLTCYFVNTAGSNTGSATYTFVASDVGKVILVTAQHTGASNTSRAFVNKAQVGADTAVVGSKPPTGVPSTFGVGAAGGNAATDLVLLAHATWQGTPSVAQVSAYADTVRTTGDLVDTFTGATVTHLWSVKRELQGVADPSGRVTQGLRAFGTANYVQTATGIGAVAGAFWIEALHRPDRIPTTYDFLFAKLDDTAKLGYQLYFNGLTLTWLIYNTSAATYGVTWTLPSSYAGRQIHIVGQYTGSAIELYIQGALVASLAAPAAYAPYVAGPLRCGVRASDNLGPLSGTLFGVGGGTGQFLTTAEALARSNAVHAAGKLTPGNAKATALWDFDGAIIGNGNAIPVTLPDTIGGDNMTRTGTLELTSYIATAPVAPAQLTDRVTGLSTDALARVGLPQVVKIDPTIDGRKTFGAQGFSLVNYLQSVAGASLVGSASGFWFAVAVNLPALPGNSNEAVCSYQTSGGNGWCLLFGNGSTLQILIGGSNYSASVALTAADIGVPFMILGHYTGSAIRLYKAGAQVGADVATTLTPATAASLRLGGSPGSSVQFSSAISSFAGGYTTSMTLAEIQQAFADFATTGVVPAIPGKTKCAYVLTTDVVASGDLTRVPAQVLDRVGTDHLTRVGPDVTIATRKGLRLSSASFLQTATGGGIQGAAAALTVSALVSPIANMTAATEMLASRFTTTGNVGWDFRRTGSAGTLGSFNVGLGTSVTAVGGTAYAIQAGDLNALIHLALTYDGATLRFYVNGVQQGAGTALTGSPVTALAAMLLGGRADVSYGNNNTAGLAVGGGAYVATQAELAAQATASIAAGQLVAIPSRTDDRRYNYDQDATDQATTLPARCIDRMGNADDLVRIGSGLTLAQRTERLWSYETAPLFSGVNGFTAANGFTCAGGPKGALTGTHVGILLRVTSQAVSAVRMLWERVNASFFGGYSFQMTGANALLTFTAYGSSGASSSATGIAIAASDVGKLIFVVGRFGGGANTTMFNKRISTGTGNPLPSYTPATAPMAVGNRGGSFPCLDVEVLGMVGGDAPLSDAECAYLYDAVMATESIQGLIGKSSWLVDFKKDTAANGGALPAAPLDRIGSANLATVGTPTVNPIYSRAWSW